MGLMVIAPLLYGVFYPQPYLGQILRHLPIAVVDLDETELSRQLVMALDADAGVQVAVRTTTIAQAQEALFERRVAQIVAEDDPVLEVIDHDAVVPDAADRSLGPVAVADELAAAADAFAARLEPLAAKQWERAGTREGERRTVLDVARRGVHEGSHHLLDIGRVLRAVRSQAK